MQKLIFGNWKMNLTAAKSFELAAKLVDCSWAENLQVAVFPTFTALEGVGRAIGTETRVKIGSQDCFWEERGAFTGEVSIAQIKEMGATHVLVGHSERRRFLGETDEMVNKKIKAARAAGLVPVLCIGESDADRRAGTWVSVIEKQTTAGLAGNVVAVEDQIVIAYEPIWAIGSGRACDPAAAGEAHSLVRNAVAEMFGVEAAQKNFNIIYGGSVDAGNIADFLSQDGIDGALVGGASQNIEAFSALLAAASNTASPKSAA